ncbi:hypothetical protein Bca52824_031965 [Brassica carinata]|uniref:Hexosyltransferase n=1 Tax=Brassica carinata TaxID=52824 RepID=A0A8X7V5R7_BRACI|nr:hypothetical protein Bca52824_031965 [Brassica carinata]
MTCPRGDDTGRSLHSRLSRRRPLRPPALLLPRKHRLPLRSLRFRRRVVSTLHRLRLVPLPRVRSLRLQRLLRLPSDLLLHPLRLGLSLNYARSYLADLLPPCVRRVVYLDSDLILVDDIAKLSATDLGRDSVLAAPEYCNANFTSYFTSAFWSNPTLS